MPTSAAEDHWNALVENNPDGAHAFALGLARMGVPVANFLKFTNNALMQFAQNPGAMKELSGVRPAGEKFVPDTAILHPGESVTTAAPTEDERIDAYVRKRYGSR